MARVTKKRKPEQPPASPLAAMLEQHLEALRVQNYSEYTIRNRRVHIGYFVEWCHQRSVTEPLDVGLPVPPFTATVTVKACAVVMLDADGVTVTVGVILGATVTEFDPVAVL